MRRLVLLLILTMVSVASGGISTRVYMAGGTTLLESQDIMVGTKLTIVVSSNVPEYWDGALALMGDDPNFAVLSAGEPLVAAGFMAAVYDWVNVEIQGFDLYTDFLGGQVGDWFVIDYIATDIGDSKVAFFDGIDYEEPFTPTYYIEFNHVRTRDLDGSTIVDFDDFAILSSYWQKSCAEPGLCEGADLDLSGTIDMNDLMLFVDYWFEKTE